jgi:hypothetical protein
MNKTNETGTVFVPGLFPSFSFTQTISIISTMDSQPLKLSDVHLSSFRHWSLKEPRKHLLNARAVDDDKDLSPSAKQDLDIPLNNTNIPSGT